MIYLLNVNIDTSTSEWYTVVTGKIWLRTATSLKTMFVFLMQFHSTVSVAGSQ